MWRAWVAPRREVPALPSDLIMPLSRRSLFALDFSGRPRPAAAALRVHRYAMSCRFEISLPATDAARVEAGRTALEEAERVEAMLSPQRETSEISRLNRQTSSDPLPLSADLFALVQYCARLHADTNGAFDATSAPLGRCRAMARREARQPTAAELRAAMALVGFDRLQLDAAEGTVRMLTPGANLGLGAVAKGYAVDRMGQVLRARDVPQALVSAGGSSVLALGGRDKGSLVTVRSEAGTESDPVLAARGGARDQRLGRAVRAAERAAPRPGRRSAHRSGAAAGPSRNGRDGRCDHRRCAVGRVRRRRACSRGVLLRAAPRRARGVDDERRRRRPRMSLDRVPARRWPRAATAQPQDDLPPHRLAENRRPRSAPISRRAGSRCPSTTSWPRPPSRRWRGR